MISIIDNALDDPIEFRDAARALTYQSFVFEHCTFHGIALGELADRTIPIIQTALTGLQPALTFFRKSPFGQEEPNYIHTDIDMGDMTGILYLNEDPPEKDGTCFWTHRQTGTIGSVVPHERSAEGMSADGWDLRLHVPARFNRLLIFPSALFHSRALYENWSKAGEDRLTQVSFLNLGSKQ